MKRPASFLLICLATSVHGFVIRKPLSRDSHQQKHNVLGSKTQVARRHSALRMFDDGIIASLSFAVTGLGVGVGLLSLFPPSNIFDDDDDEDIDLSEEDIKSLTEKLRYKTKVGDGRNADLVKGDDRMDRITKLWYEGTRFKNSGSVKNEYAPYGAEKHRNSNEIVATVGALNQNYLNGLSDTIRESSTPSETHQYPVASGDDYLSRLSYVPPSALKSQYDAFEPRTTKASKPSTISSADYLKSLSVESTSSPVIQLYSPYKSQKGKKSDGLPSSSGAGGYLDGLSRASTEKLSSGTSEPKVPEVAAADNSRSGSYLDALSGAPSTAKPASYLPFNRSPHAQERMTPLTSPELARSGSTLNYLDALTPSSSDSPKKASYLPFKTSKTGSPSSLPYTAGKAKANSGSNDESSGSNRSSQMATVSSKSILNAGHVTSYSPFKASWKTSTPLVNGAADHYEDKVVESKNTIYQAASSAPSSGSVAEAGRTFDSKGNYLQSLGGGSSVKVSSYGPGQWSK